jgi:hypothetical protein
VQQVIENCKAVTEVCNIRSIQNTKTISWLFWYLLPQAAGLGMFIVGLLIGPDDVTGLAPLTLTSFMTGVIVEVSICCSSSLYLGDLPAHQHDCRLCFHSLSAACELDVVVLILLLWVADGDSGMLQHTRLRFHKHRAQSIHHWSPHGYTC